MKHCCTALTAIRRLSSVKHCLSSAEIHQLAATTHGFVGADLAALVNESAMTALRRHVRAQQQHEQGQQQQYEASGQQQQQNASSLCVTWGDVCAARLLIKPSALREVAIEVPQVRVQNLPKRVCQAFITAKGCCLWCCLCCGSLAYTGIRLASAKRCR
jgi:SpoVK/Ycf46/Vps4 family AAA+-type ATPase